MSNPITKFALATDSRISIAPDHKAVRLKLKISNCGRGPGLWKFNNSLLEGENYVNLIKDNYPKIKENYIDIEDKRLKWELIKMEIRSLIIPYSKNKVIAKRIESVLPKLINPNQTGFVKGRYIGQNIRLLTDVLEQTKRQDIPGILLLLDFRKAFDTLEWPFIQQTLSLFNFGESIIPALGVNILR